jgi:hypothetical protein
MACDGDGRGRGESMILSPEEVVEKRGPRTRQEIGKESIYLGST